MGRARGRRRAIASGAALCHVRAMPATPAWPPASTPRLFVPAPLYAGEARTIDGPAAHYLGTVMRLRVGDPVVLCDDATGAWRADVTHSDRRRVGVTVVERLAPRDAVPDFWLCLAPIKKGRVDWAIEKATELGVARIVPVLTARTIVDRVNLDRWRAHAVEAAEQCGRTALPELVEAMSLDHLLRGWPAGRRLLFADESGGAPVDCVDAPAPAGLLVGPEGGFTPHERDAIRAHPDAVAITLGPRILRAETAVVAGTALWMQRHGDWLSQNETNTQRW